MMLQRMRVVCLLYLASTVHAVRLIELAVAAESSQELDCDAFGSSLLEGLTSCLKICDPEISFFATNCPGPLEFDLLGSAQSDLEGPGNLDVCIGLTLFSDDCVDPLKEDYPGLIGLQIPATSLPTFESTNSPTPVPTLEIVNAPTGSPTANKSVFAPTAAPTQVHLYSPPLFAEASDSSDSKKTQEKVAVVLLSIFCPVLLIAVLLFVILYCVTARRRQRRFSIDKTIPPDDFEDETDDPTDFAVRSVSGPAPALGGEIMLDEATVRRQNCRRPHGVVPPRLPPICEQESSSDLMVFEDDPVSSNSNDAEGNRRLEVSDHWV